ncbi:hypothetical protein ACIQXW_11285 [Lysinibacillus sp. NPDC097162]|uniref:hypothetical protein n=1 Tax=Lysinibacillus sp. NPDC097162 TaxID=3364140 RepID=UPI0038094A89
MLEIINKKVVLTRKTHECYGCLKEIERRINAIYVTAKQDEQQMRFHLHEKCNKIIAKDKWFMGSGLFKGCIKEAEKVLEVVESINITADEGLPFI